MSRTDRFRGWCVAFLTLLIGTVRAQSEEVLRTLAENAVRIQIERRDGVKPKKSHEVFVKGSGVLIEGGQYLATNVHVGARREVQKIAASIEHRRPLGQVVELVPRVLDLDECTTTSCVLRCLYRGPPFSETELELRLLANDGKFLDVSIMQPTNVRGRGFTKYCHSSDIAKDIDENKAVELWALGSPNGDAYTLMSGFAREVWTPGAVSPKRASVEHRQAVDDTVRKRINKDDMEFELLESYDSLILATNFAAPGASGSPVVDRYGRLVGIVWGRVTVKPRGESTQQRTLIIPSEAVLRQANITKVASDATPTPLASPANRQEGGSHVARAEPRDRGAGEESSYQESALETLDRGKILIGDEGPRWVPFHQVDPACRTVRAFNATHALVSWSDSHDAIRIEPRFKRDEVKYIRVESDPQFRLFIPKALPSEGSLAQIAYYDEEARVLLLPREAGLLNERSVVVLSSKAGATVLHRADRIESWNRVLVERE